jgi:hypothetical protein
MKGSFVCVKRSVLFVKHALYIKCPKMSRVIPEGKRVPLQSALVVQTKFYPETI